MYRNILPFKLDTAASRTNFLTQWLRPLVKGGLRVSIGLELWLGFGLGLWFGFGLGFCQHSHAYL